MSPSAATSAERPRTRWIVPSPMPDRSRSGRAERPTWTGSRKRRWPRARPSTTPPARPIRSVPRPWASQAAPRRALYFYDNLGALWNRAHLMKTTLEASAREALIQLIAADAANGEGPFAIIRFQGRLPWVCLLYTYDAA